MTQTPTEDTDLEKAVRTLATILCPLNHPERWTDGDTAYVCDTCVEVATQTCGSDFLVNITHFREQQAASRAVSDAAAQVPAIRDLTEKPEPYQKIKAHLEAQAAEMAPLEPVEDQAPA